jgi:geranylgeranyl reductase family protein
MDSYDCIVVGGGPSGASAARILAEKGHKVILLDSKIVPGSPVQCGESISINTLKLSGLEENGPWTVNKVSGYRIRSPSGKDLFSSTTGVNIKRDVFDKELWSRAEAAGAHSRSRTHIGTIRKKVDGSWDVKGRNINLSGRALVMACGVNRHLLSQIFPEYAPTTIKALGAKISTKDDSEELLFYVKGSLRGGYGWYFPRMKEVNVGIATFGNVREEFQWVLNRTGVSKDQIISYHGGEIPVTGMTSVNIGDDCILVGDSGGFSNPISKGGVVGAILSGITGAEAISDSISGNGGSLEKWKKSMIEHPAFSPLNLDRMSFLASLDDRNLDSLTDIADGRDIWTIKKTEVIKKAWKRPWLIRSVKGSLHLVKGGRDWANWAF